jgi:hypothetical protein
MRLDMANNSHMGALSRAIRREDPGLQMVRPCMMPPFVVDDFAFPHI